MIKKIGTMKLIKDPIIAVTDAVISPEVEKSIYLFFKKAYNTYIKEIY